ncbi:MAG: hypothetical protein H6667_15710 [Ardenticatenaceae bacterium]|nr:hypothetical protein [Ardenticatenaceae bacterium]
MERPSAYIPMDRRQAILRGETLPSDTSGAALFADVSGFAPSPNDCCKNSAHSGVRKEQPSLNSVYDALITELHRFGGSVIGFSGDAITCWFDGDDVCG